MLEGEAKNKNNSLLAAMHKRPNRRTSRGVLIGEERALVTRGWPPS